MQHTLPHEVGHVTFKRVQGCFCYIDFGRGPYGITTRSRMPVREAREMP